MTRDDDFIGQLEGYLDEYEGMTPVPDAVRDAVRAQLPTTKQIAPFAGPMRYMTLSTNLPTAIRYGLVAAVAIVAVVLGVALLGRPNIGHEPEPTATSSSAPTAGLDGNRYSITNDTEATTTFILPAHWKGYEWYVSGPRRAFIGVSAVGNVFADPCHWIRSLAEPAIGPTVDDLATALANQVGFEGPTSDVTIGGFNGIRVRQSVPADLNIGECDGGEFRTWVGLGGPNDSRNLQGAGQSEESYILDVNGIRLVINVSYFPDTPQAQRDEIQQILDTIQIK